MSAARTGATPPPRRPARAPVDPPLAWRDAFDALPREGFLPDRIWPHDLTDDSFTTVRRREDPAAWQAAAEGDVPIVTQWDDGAADDPAPGADATSSASRPSLVAFMLAALAVEPGARVLEIGTGTGWNAALLAHRLGEENVTTVEIDPRIAAVAREALDGAGLHPRVVVGDGALGVPDGAPFDRIIATCGMRSIPRAWCAQVRPGGMILVPWGTRFSRRDALARLTVHGDGTASGPFLKLVAFMKLRSQRHAHPRYPRDLPVTDTTTGSWPPHGGEWHPLPFLAGLRMRQASYALQRHEDGHTQWLYSLAGDSWTAAVRRGRTGPRTVVRQAGHRPLWEEYTAVHEWWTAEGEPGLGHFGLTVTPGGEQVWLDSEERVVPPLTGRPAAR